MKHRPNWDALAFCLLWALLAAIGFHVDGLRAGIALSVGLFPIIMLSSALILSRRGDFRLERIVRWSILAAAASAFAAYADISS